MMHVTGLVMFGWTLNLQTLVIGALTGLTYAVLAAGLVLVYRATKVINFAHGEIGALGAAILAKLVLDEHWNFYVAFALMLLLGGAIGAIVELTIVRRLFRAPRLVLLVATIGVSQLLLVCQLFLPDVHHIAQYPSPLHRTMHVGSLLLLSQHFMVIAFVPAVIAGLAFFLSRTPYGIAIRAAAENPDRAELAGISTKRVSTGVWILAGILSTLTAILINPIRGTMVGLPTPALGPGLLLRALAAGMVGGLESLPLALVGGVGLGMVEAVIFSNSTPGLADAVMLVFVLVLVLLRGSGAAGDEGGWSLAPSVTAIPNRLRQFWWVRRLNVISAGAGLAVALLLPVVFTTSARNFLFARVAVFALIGITVTVLTGWAGQLSLGQFAFVGLGSMLTAALHARGMGFGVSVAYATVGGVIAALIVGLPALRVKGLFLAITTLAFAVASRGWLLTQHVFLGNSTVVNIPRGKGWGIDLHSQRTYYYLCVFVLVVVAVGISRLRRSGIGRTIIATRDNEAAAASFTVSPTIAKLTAFALAGGLAALAGGLLAGLRVTFGPGDFGPEVSLQVVAMAVIGGLGSVTGAILGAIFVVGLPAVFGNSDTVRFLTSGIGLLVLLLYLPGGLIQIAYRARAAQLSLAARRLPPATAGSGETVATRVLPARRGADEAVPSGVPALAVSGITVRFGGRHALEDVTICAEQGEVVGLIGANGAGKSTLMNVISGFIAPTAGQINLFGTDVTHLVPYERARVGVGRVFQDARLFTGLTVLETVQVALEAHVPSELVPSLLALPPSLRAEAAKTSEAADYIAFLGLSRYADSFCSDISTGTRRIVEMCCLLAQGSRLLLLDEPTAGVAQRETEAFGPLIRRIQRELGATVVIIEHDIPLVMSISDRVYCLGAGKVIAEGPPEEVRANPAVIASYLGTDERAIARSGASAEELVSVGVEVAVGAHLDGGHGGGGHGGGGHSDHGTADEVRIERVDDALDGGVDDTAEISLWGPGANGSSASDGHPGGDPRNGNGTNGSDPTHRLAAADLGAMPRVELVRLAGELGVSGRSRMRKDELIAAIEEQR
jgi:ABC-type branched-subunit amino acid transport system ATPase component/ABC-type branched-subunit amino acid transport system permease subunit